MDRVGPVARAGGRGRLFRTAYGWAALWMALPFVAIGGFFALAGFDFLPLPGEAHAPRWVIGAVGVAFASGGLVLLGHALRGLWERRRVARVRRRHPDRPWLLDYPWDSGGIDDWGAAPWLASLSAALVVGALAVPFNWWAFYSGEGVLAVRIATILLNLILLGIVLAFLYRLARFLKYGRTRLTFMRFPFAPGGRIDIGLSPVRFAQMQVTLRFVEEALEWRRSGSRRSATHRVIERWRETRQVTAQARDRELIVSFQLPDEPEWVTDLTAHPGVSYWEVVVEAVTPGIDLRSRFPLPVYAHGASQATSPQRLAPIGGGWHTPLAFELGLPLIFAAMLALAWWQSPRSVERALEGTAVAMQRVWFSLHFRAIDGVYPDVMGVAGGPDGRTWVLSKYGVHRFSDDGGEESLLDGAGYRAATGHRPEAMSALSVVGTDEAWVGGWRGELLHYRAGTWRALGDRAAPLRARLRALAVAGDRLYIVGGDGTWRFDDQAGLVAVGGVPSGAAQAVAMRDADSLAVGVDRRLVWLHRDVARTLWRGTPDDGAITAVRGSPSGGWLVGTDNGLVALGADGHEQVRTLRGHRITQIEQVGDRWWVGTWDAGLCASGDLVLWRCLGASAGLPRDKVSGFAMGPAGRVWIGLYGWGVARTTVDELLAIADDLP